MIAGGLTLIGVIVGWRIAQAREDRRFWWLYVALNPSHQISNTTPPTTAELNAGA